VGDLTLDRHRGFLALPDELTPVSDTWKTVNVIGKLGLKPFVNVGVFLKKKLNDRSLPGLPSSSEKYKRREMLTF
jgi:hypothetical protein